MVLFVLIESIPERKELRAHSSSLMEVSFICNHHIMHCMEIYYSIDLCLLYHTYAHIIEEQQTATFHHEKQISCEQIKVHCNDDMITRRVSECV
jgi:hypothetical protein